MYRYQRQVPNLDALLRGQHEFNCGNIERYGRYADNKVNCMTIGTEMGIKVIDNNVCKIGY